ncbi:MAG: hypothetical protein GY775_16570, partial [Candidatus Scalindua sp.]|nr:hypothetical protein [Candidatus Scalindua sp.]
MDNDGLKNFVGFLCQSKGDKTVSYINKLPQKKQIRSISQTIGVVLVIGSIMLLMVGCVNRQTSTTTPTTSIAEKKEFIDKKPAGSNEYETPDILRASEIVPPELLEGKNYNIHEDVLTYGFTNYYTIVSPVGTFDVEGDEMLRIRIHEVKAIEALQEIKKSEAFGEAAKKAATSSVKGAWGLITQPVKTVSGVPKGVGRLFSRFGEMVDGDRGDSEDSVTKELIGFSAVKRQYAHKMGVDVYSSNEELQKELNSVSWAGFAGGVGISLATRAVKGASELAY